MSLRPIASAAQNGPPAASPSVDRAYEVEREALIAMIERERRALPSSLLALVLIALAITYLPDPDFMFALLALRFVSFLFTRTAAARLERLARRRQKVQGARRMMTAAMALTGVTLGLLLWPQPTDAWPVAKTVIEAIALVALTLIAVTLAALPRARDVMLATFWLTVCGLVLLHPHAGDSALILAYTIPLVGIRLYSASAGRHMLESARTLVHNRELSEDLTNALAQAEYLSWRDPLTRLYNRRKLFDEDRGERCELTRHILTVDLDRFKLVNDSFGHDIGDRVLVATADSIRSWLASLPHSPNHIAFRLGGEEFLVILRGLDEYAMTEAAEGLRLIIADLPRQLRDLPDLRVSASIGFTSWRSGEPLDIAMQRADAACYAAKHGGRNRVRCAA